MSCEKANQELVFTLIRRMEAEGICLTENQCVDILSLLLRQNMCSPNKLWQTVDDAVFQKLSMATETILPDTAAKIESLLKNVGGEKTPEVSLLYRILNLFSLSPPVSEATTAAYTRPIECVRVSVNHSGVCTHCGTQLQLRGLSDLEKRTMRMNLIGNFLNTDNIFKKLYHRIINLGSASATDAHRKDGLHEFAGQLYFIGLNEILSSCPGEGLEGCILSQEEIKQESRKNKYPRIIITK